MELIRRIEEAGFKPNINNNLLIQLVSLSGKVMTFKINNKFYQQADGLFIGSLSSPCFAEICIQRCEEISVYNMIHALGIWLFKADYTFVITKQNKNNIPAELNKINGNSKFTVEEKGNKAM